MNRRVWTAWRSADGSVLTFAAGEDRPRLANGEFEPDCEIPLWRCEAANHEEAMAIRNLRFGWAPYEPEGEAAPCPACGAPYYPDGSAQCWRCDHEG